MGGVNGFLSENQDNTVNADAKGTEKTGQYNLTDTIYIPLQFWFCRNPGLALPLIALQYHEVKVILNHKLKDIFGGNPSNRLWCDYIYLDTDERKEICSSFHELSYRTTSNTREFICKKFIKF